MLNMFAICVENTTIYINNLITVCNSDFDWYHCNTEKGIPSSTKLEVRRFM